MNSSDESGAICARGERMSRYCLNLVAALGGLASAHGCSPTYEPNGELAPGACNGKNPEIATPLGYPAGTKTYIIASPDHIYTEYSDSRNLRTEFGYGLVNIVNHDIGKQFIIDDIEGKTYAIEHTIERKPYGTYRWQGKSLACRIGPCLVNGISGVEWTHPSTLGISESRACITADGIVLRDTNGGKYIYENKTLDRKPVPASMFLPPPGMRIISEAEADRIRSDASAALRKRLADSQNR
jgi:hypothetical protein